MESHTFGRIGRSASVIGLGTWQLGADWGEVSESDALAVLEAAVGDGVTFLDTADVYGDGRSEQVIGRFVRSHDDIFVATKMGRRAEQVPSSYTLDAFRGWLDRSRSNLGVDTIDLVQLHCPPTETIESAATYDALDTLVSEGVIAAYGVSVETCDQALAAIARPNVASVQIILNAFRLKPLDRVLPAAAEAGVGIIARVPLASGLLSGRYTESTTFAADDHRTYNRHGEAFDVGETFSGVDFAVGVEAAAEFSALVKAHGPAGAMPSQVALAWVAQQPGVTTVIPGARNPDQAESNAFAGELGPLSPELLAGVRRIYDTYFREAIHSRW
jgi:aryl-alcohol dehydrogenase-like predicted oxidoreductase